MFSLVGFHESRAGVPAYGEVAAEPDAHIHVEGDNVYVPAWANHLLATLVGETTATAGAVTQAKLYTPSHKSIALPNIEHDASGTPWEPHSPSALNDFRGRNIYLTPSESLQLQTINSGTNTEVTTGIVALGNGKYVSLPGEIITKRFTAAITCVAYNWVGGGALTFEEGLDAGRYAVVGMKLIGASALAARLVGLNEVGQARPGCVAFDAITDIDIPMFRNGNLGVWGTFVHNTPPTLEAFAVTTDSAQEGYLDLIKIG